MKISEITVGRKFNLGNYESMEIRVSVNPSPDEESKQFEDGSEQIITKLNDEILKLKEKISPTK